MLKRTSKKSYDSHKDRFKKISEKKFTTCFMNPICKFEENFGYLWGHNIENGKLTNEQKQLKIIWELVRKDILDNGNRQKRAMNSEIDLHQISFTGYRMEFKGDNNV